MSSDESPTPSPASASAPAGAGEPGLFQGMRTTVTTAVAAAALVAVTVFSGPTPLSQADSILTSPVNSSASRIAGVQEDLDRAVALQQLTREQADFFEKQLVGKIKRTGTA